MSIRALAFALYVEGPSDSRFLPVLVQRTIFHILAAHRRTDVDVLDLEVLNDELHRIPQGNRILEAARRARHSEALFIHIDADHPTRERVMVG